MARWAGWGAGPAGAGAAGGPGKIFLGGSLLFAAGVAVALAAQGRWIPAALGAVAAVYFALRLFGGLGRGA
jgi:Na+-translocating ferredoxin:NAD+ oxidoreductase RnfD subunit